MEDIKRFKIVRDAIADQFCIFFNIDKKAVTTEIDKIRRRSVETDKYTLKSRQFHYYNSQRENRKNHHHITHLFLHLILHRQNHHLKTWIVLGVHKVPKRLKEEGRTWRS